MDLEDTNFSATLSRDVHVLFGNIITISKSSGRPYVNFDVDGRGVDVPVVDLTKLMFSLVGTVSTVTVESTVIADDAAETKVQVI